MTTLEQAARDEGAQWKALFWEVARRLNCLPSTYVDANDHVLRKAAALAAGQAQPVADLRCAKWLDPECADAGACQSLKFKAAHPAQPLTDEQIDDACAHIFSLDHDSHEQYDRAIARAIERAHGIGAQA